ncbi:hypothetical protein BDD12DRAFT_920393 [Trichophaea hybrida]|nr:hypothetical protein BDD12DRAFT_920393 [Trichophaea hybrida]
MFCLYILITFYHPAAIVNEAASFAHCFNQSLSLSSQSLSDLSGSEDFLPSEAESEFSPGAGSSDSNSQVVSTSPTSTYPLLLSPSNALNSSIASTSSPAAYRHSRLTFNSCTWYDFWVWCKPVLEVLLLFDEVYEWRYNEAGPPFKKIPFHKDYPWSSSFANYLLFDNVAKFDKEQFSQKVVDEMRLLWIIYANIPFRVTSEFLFICFCGVAFLDWSRPSPSSPRLPVWGPVQSDLPIGPDGTEPYPRPDLLAQTNQLSVPMSELELICESSMMLALEKQEEAKAEMGEK